MNSAQRNLVRRAIDAKARELVDGTNYNDPDYVLAYVLPDYEPERLPAAEPGAWMPLVRYPRVWNARHPRWPRGRHV